LPASQAEKPPEDVVFTRRKIRSELPSVFKGMEEEPRIEFMPRISFKTEPVEEELELFKAEPSPAKAPEPVLTRPLSGPTPFQSSMRF